MRRFRNGRDDVRPPISDRRGMNRFRDGARRWHDAMHSCRGFPRKVRHRLYLQIYLSFLGVFLAAAFAVAGIAWLTNSSTKHRADRERYTPVLMRLLPRNADAQTIQTAMEEIARVAESTVALYDETGELQAKAGQQTVPQSITNADHNEFGMVYTLPDGRKLAERRDHGPLLAVLAGFALLTAIGALPVAHRLTRRLEALQKQADAWADGNLGARADVQGDDEVAELARRFNQAAERIQSLLDSQRQMLASASHELRSPLARIRMAVDLLEDERPDLREHIARDIGELDALIGDLLLASRLSFDKPSLQLGEVELLSLAAEEAGRLGAEVGGCTVCVRGDMRLLRHLVRNLLDNARRYAPGTTVEVDVVLAGEQAILHVMDRGPGVPENERERIFEPFYRLAGSAERGEGVGYGLALVRRIARLHGGEVRCLPREGGGACFEVNLPAKGCNTHATV